MEDAAQFGSMLPPAVPQQHQHCGHPTPEGDIGSRNPAHGGRIELHAPYKPPNPHHHQEIALAISPVQTLQDSLVMAEETGRKKRSLKRLGVASYSGREGSSHYFSVSYENGTVELLTVVQLGACITANTKHATGARAAATLALASKPASMSRYHNIADVTT